MAFEDLLVHTANTFRRDGNVDEFNQPTDVQKGEAYLVGVPCRANIGTGSEQFGERSIDVIVDKTTIYFPVGTDIREDDELEVYAADGVTLIAGTTTLFTAANIVSVSVSTGRDGQPHHVEVDIQTVRGPQ